MTQIEQLENQLLQTSGKEKLEVLNILSSIALSQAPEKVVEYAQQALTLAQELASISGQAIALNNMGAALIYFSDYDQALDAFQQALDIFEDINHKDGIASVLLNMGIVYYYLENTNKSLEYYQQALQICQELDDQLTIAGIALNMGNIHTEQEEYHQALEYFSRALSIFEKLQLENEIAKSLDNLGKIHNKLANYEQALTYHLAAFEIFETLSETDRGGMGENLINIGDTYTNLKDFETAYTYLQRGLDIAQKIKAKYLMKDACYALSMFFVAQEDYQNAFVYYIQYTEIKDKIFNAERSKKIAEMQAKYETEKKEQEAEIYRLKNVELAQLNVELEEKNEKLVETQLQLVRTQAQRIENEKLATLGKLANMVAHELNNSLTGIISPIEQLMKLPHLDEEKIWYCWESDQEGTELDAYLKQRREELERHQQLVGLIQTAAQRSQVVVNDLQGLVGRRSQKLGSLNLVEVFRETCRLYSRQLEHLRLIEDFEAEEISITATGGEIGQIFINLLMNAAEALIDHPEPFITVSIYTKDDGVEIKVKDNGIGIPEDIQKQIFEPFFTTKGVPNSGLGLFTTRRILSEYNGTIAVESQEGEGATFIFWLPNDGKKVETLGEGWTKNE